jgi:Tol biopolymer transport system component
VSGDVTFWSPVWSPDGEWIAFIRSQELWLIHPDGSGSHRLFGESKDLCIGEPMWSPDGQQIAFASHECTPATRAEKVWIINRDGTDPRAVHTFERRPDLAKVYWGHDGREIVCSHEYHGEEMRLLLIDAAGVGEPYLIDELPFWWIPSYWPQWRREQ